MTLPCSTLRQPQRYHVSQAILSVFVRHGINDRSLAWCFRPQSVIRVYIQQLKIVNSPTLTGSTFIACHMAPSTIKACMIHFPAFDTLFLFVAIVIACSMIGFRENISIRLAFARIVVGLDWIIWHITSRFVPCTLLNYWTSTACDECLRWKENSWSGRRVPMPPNWHCHI